MYKRIHPSGYALTQLKLYYRRYVQTLNPSMRQTYAPGETMFVDYSGSILNVHNTMDGTLSKAQIFVSVLGASRMTFVHATASKKQEVGLPLLIGGGIMLWWWRRKRGKLK